MRPDQEIQYPIARRERDEMKRGIRNRLGRKHLILVLSLSMILSAMVCDSYGMEDKKVRFGFSFLGGPDADNRADIRLLAFLPRVDFMLHRLWDLEFEGNFSYYGISEQKNLYFLGVNSNILLKPIQWKKGSLFLLGGGGLGYDNGNGRVRQIGDSHFAGILQAGGGLMFDIGEGVLLRAEYRYQHLSEPLDSDPGLNTHNLALGLSF
jgi:hypothetical protein